MKKLYSKKRKFDDNDDNEEPFEQPDPIQTPEDEEIIDNIPEIVIE